MPRLWPKNPTRAFLDVVDSIKMMKTLDPNHREYAIAQALVEDFRWSFQRNMQVKSSSGRATIDRLIGKTTLGGEKIREPGGIDHRELWIRDGKPALFTSQPYGLHWDEIVETVDFCRAHGLQFRIDAESWHFPSRTILVTFSKDL